MLVKKKREENSFLMKCQLLKIPAIMKLKLFDNNNYNYCSHDKKLSKS